MRVYTSGKPEEPRNNKGVSIINNINIDFLVPSLTWFGTARAKGSDTGQVPSTQHLTLQGTATVALERGKGSVLAGPCDFLPST